MTGSYFGEGRWKAEKVKERLDCHCSRSQKNQKKRILVKNSKKKTMVSTRRTASSLSAQAAAAGKDDDDAATGAESRLTPTPVEKKKTAAAAAKKQHQPAAAAAAPAAKSKSNASAPSSPPRRHAGTSLRPVTEEEGKENARLAKTAPSPLRKSAQGRGAKQSPANTKSKGKAAASASPAADAADASSDEDDADADGLACLAQGMLYALCGLPGGQKKQFEREGSDGDDDGDLPPQTPTPARNVDGNDGDGGASPSSSDSDSEGSEDEDDDEGGGRTAAAAPANISWAPASLQLPRPATATPAVELLARKAKRGEHAAAETNSLALPRLSRKSEGSGPSSAAPPRRPSHWFDLPTQTLTPELKTDLRLLMLRGAMDPTRHYKNADTTKLPSRFHVGTVVESRTDFYSSRLSKSERGQTLTHELLKDRTLSAQRKRRFGALQEAAAARGKRGGGKGAKERKTSMPRLKKHRVRPKH